MAFIWISAVLLFLIKNAESEYNPEVCSILEESCGLIPPPLPKNFEMKSERVDHVTNTSTYEEIYFDYTNWRAKYIVLVNTTEYHYLFDYATQQVVEWIRLHPGVSIERDPLSLVCTAVDMDSSSKSKMFGYQGLQDQRTKMFNSNQMLRFGGPYLYAANGSLILDDRNLKVNKFIGCIYDEANNATLFNEFYFADTNYVLPAGGTSSTLLTASTDEKPLSVPLKIRVTGEYGKGAETLPINMTFSISWFRGKPDFDPKTFLIPPWVNCKNYFGRKDMPKLPDAFSTRLDITQYQVDSLGKLFETGSDTSYEEIYYDAGKKLARRDFTPTKRMDTEVFSRFGSYTPVSTIFDFNEGLMYGIHKASGRCFIRPIVENDFFDTEEPLLYRKMAKPEELFRMQMDEMEYKGKNFARDVMCDVFNGKHYHKQYESNFIKETYFSTEGWHEFADEVVEYSVPVRHLLIKESLDDNLTESVMDYNFMKFKAKAPVLASFDIKNCVEQIDHKRFAIQLLNVSNLENVFKRKFVFLETAQMYITNNTGVNTPLRVQRLHLRHLSVKNPVPFLVFSLLEKANLNDLPVVVGQKGKNLADAIILLQKLVQSGKFVIQFKDPKTNELVAVPSGQNVLYTLTPEGVLTPAPAFAEADVDAKAEEVKEEDDKIVVEHHGMTGGHLALLAFSMLFIGVGIGIAVMYLYIRVYGDRLVEDKMDMRSSSAAATSGI